MGILGLTHDNHGAALEKLPVTIKVAIGEGPEAGNRESGPRKLDHFVFKRKRVAGQEILWHPAPDIAEAHGSNPSEIGIIFLNDDPQDVFRTEYAWWTTAACKCHGELVQIDDGNEVRFEMQAIRRTQRHPEGEAWPGKYRYVDETRKGQPVEPCGEGCPDLERGDCRPSGDLYFILEKFPTFGAVCRLHTSSYRSIRNISNGLMQLRRLSGGRLAGIKAILKASPERVSYTDRDGMRRNTIAYILSLEMAGRDLRSLVQNMTGPMRLLKEGAIANEVQEGPEYLVQETETERAGELSEEFYPENGRAPEGAASVSSTPNEGDEQIARICELARRVGHNDAKTKMLLGQWAAKLGDLEGRLLDELDERPPVAPV